MKWLPMHVVFGISIRGGGIEYQSLFIPVDISKYNFKMKRLGVQHFTLEKYKRLNDL